MGSCWLDSKVSTNSEYSACKEDNHIYISEENVINKN